MLTIVDQTEALAVVALAGRLDSSTASALEVEFGHLVREGHRWLVLDFTGVTMLASAGLRLLLRVESDCRKNQGALVLAAVPKPVKVVLELAGFAPHFQCHPDAASARAALEGPPAK